MGTILLQGMKQLIECECSGNWEFTFHAYDHSDDFSKYFAVNRSDSDMIIELTLMRSRKTHEGLTSEREITNPVLAAPTSTKFCSALENFAGLHFCTGEQHANYRAFWQRRDDDDDDSQ